LPAGLNKLLPISRIPSLRNKTSRNKNIYIKKFMREWHNCWEVQFCYTTNSLIFRKNDTTVEKYNFVSTYFLFLLNEFFFFHAEIYVSNFLHELKMSLIMCSGQKKKRFSLPAACHHVQASAHRFKRRMNLWKLHFLDSDRIKFPYF
jgi:hypothetical protein